MRDPRINLKDPWIAALLAWLIPGAGHFYQGRTFKGAIYSVCILGLFLSGWAMADWSAVQPPDVRNPGGNKTLLLKYTAQLGVGLPSLYGLAQSRRFASEDNVPTTHLDGPVSSEFEGIWLPQQFGTGDLRGMLQRIEFAHQDVEYADWPLDSGVPAAGRITLEPAQTELGGTSIKATFEGTIDGRPTDLKLDSVVLEEPIRSSPRRRVFAVGRDPAPASDRTLGILVASIPRPFLNYIAVPLSPREENLLHGKHGNYLEIWMVFTWIAGLLNMLAVWDAFDGPAYAYGDESASEGDSPPPPEDGVGATN
ncbi:MAG: TM2 domain-containing protein [Planctomycetaceae bacterium]|nr:TM2 domain-containing protein [Planctomycetaceae bacterium]